jgi:hypothetical protein
MLEFKNGTFTQRKDLAEWKERETYEEYAKRLGFEEAWDLGYDDGNQAYLQSWVRLSDGARLVSVGDNVAYGLSLIYCENEAEFANLLLKIAPLLSVLTLDSLKSELDDAVRQINHDRKRRGYSNEQKVHLSDLLRKVFERALDFE